jgi:hypothetical protein
LSRRITQETFGSIGFWIQADAVDVGELFFMRVRELFCFAIETSAAMLLQCYTLALTYAPHAAQGIIPQRQAENENGFQLGCSSRIFGRPYGGWSSA